jgi:hypothetical protein
MVKVFLIHAPTDIELGVPNSALVVLSVFKTNDIAGHIPEVFESVADLRRDDGHG